MSDLRCCAKCRTPYNCGNKSCSCHPAGPDYARLILEAQASRAAFEITYARGERDPDTGVTPNK